MQQSTFMLINCLKYMRQDSPRPSFANATDLINAILARNVYADCTSIMYIIYYIEHKPSYEFTYWPTHEQLRLIDAAYDIKYVGIDVRHRSGELITNYLTIENKGLSIIKYLNDYLSITPDGIVVHDLDTWIDYSHVQMIKESMEKNDVQSFHFLHKYHSKFGVMAWL